MPADTGPQPVTDQTAAPSVGSGVGDTVAAPSAPVTESVSADGFGPSAAAGEIGMLGPYRVVKELGRGGMGAVFAAIDTRLDRPLALKVMLPDIAADRDAKERFLREARAAAKVGHDNVVTVYEADERGGVPYIAMQFLEGMPLDAFLKRKGAPSVTQTLRIGMEAAAGLAAAHKLGLVHRDIKPANLWLEAPNGRVKVLDFGLARPVDGDTELTKSGAVVGTPAYMSPEQARGEKVDHRTDLFSLGAVLYRLCTGKLPFSGPSTMAVLMALGTEEPPPVRERNPDVPEALAALVHQLLSKRADDRPQSALDVAKRLRAIAQNLAAPRPAASELSTSQPQLVQPQVVPVPIPVPVATQNPFADLDEPGDETTEQASAERAPEPERKAERKKPRGFGPLLIACGLLALAAVAAVGVIIVIKNKDGTETKIEVPDGATVTVKDKGGKTLAQVGPEKAKPVAGGDPDRAAAEYALSVGGSVQVTGRGHAFQNPAELPKERFTLTLVSLGGPKVTDAGLESFKGCKGLTSLDLGNSSVTDAGLAHFKDCKGLTHLGLGGNPQVTDAGLAHFKDCKGLTALVLLNTPVTDAGLANFKDCKGLTKLDLFGTRVTDTGLAHFKDCTGLTLLSLGTTGVTDQGLAHFKDCKGLTALNLNGTGVTDVGLAHFKDCKGLTIMALTGTKVTDDGLALFKDRRVSELELGGTRVTEKGLAQFKDVENLTNIHLFGTGLTDAGLALFKNCKRLNYVYVGNNPQLTDAGFAHLKDCKELIRFEARGTGLTDAGLALFKGCKGLRDVLLNGTKVTAKGLADFHAAVPGCTIEHDGGVIEPKAAADPDRRAAEYALSVGGVVRVADQNRDFTAAADLPKERFTLTLVQLGGPKVTDAGLASFKGCTGLTWIVLGNTPGVTDAGLAHFTDCKGLTHLDLGGCTEVTDAGLGHFKGCTKLTALGLLNAPVTDAGLAQFRDCTGLKALILHGTKATDAGLAHFKDCKGLTNLDLGATGVTDAGLALFKDCKLTALNVSGARLVTDAGLAHFKDCTLTALQLGDTKVTDAGLAQFKNCTGLQILHLYATKVTDVGLAHFKDCTELTILELTGVAVTDAGLAPLRDCKKLTNVDVRQTKVTAKGLEAFHAAVPGCKIEHDGGTIEPKAAADPDRTAAEYVLSVGGSVQVNGQEREYEVAADLPKERFTLTWVSLGNTAVTDAGLANFKDCKGLTVLDLWATAVTDAGLANFKDHKRLTLLNLGGTAVTDAGLALFKDCKGLTHLYLNKTAVTDAGLTLFKDRKALAVLHLNDTAVTDAGLAHFMDCKGLTQLTLSNTAVTDAGLAHFRDCKKLAIVDVRRTKVTAKGLGAFRAAVPGCKIEHDGGTIEPKK